MASQPASRHDFLLTLGTQSLAASSSCQMTAWLFQFSLLLGTALSGVSERTQRPRGRLLCPPTLLRQGWDREHSPLLTEAWFLEPVRRGGSHPPGRQTKMSRGVGLNQGHTARGSKAPARLLPDALCPPCWWDDIAEQHQDGKAVYVQGPAGGLLSVIRRQSWPGSLD